MNRRVSPQSARDDHRLEEELRVTLLRTISPARRDEIVARLRDAEAAAVMSPEHCPWWRRPVPLWRAAAAGLALATASAAMALGIARNDRPDAQSPIVHSGSNDVNPPAAIVFVEHDWPRHNTDDLDQPGIRGWRFMSIEHGEILQ